MRKLRSLLVAVPLALLAACGGGGDEPEAPADGGDGGAQAVSVTAVDNAFEPSTVTVPQGGSIELTNEGQALHNFQIEAEGIDQDVAAGEAITVDVSGLAAGTYDFVCKYHVSVGMTGTMTVEG